MTNKEAIQFLDNMRGQESGRAIGTDGFYSELCGYHVQALNVAIKALSEQRTGHWIDTGSKNFDYNRVYKCSECCNTEIEYPERIHRHFRYCPNCGAKMESEDKE